MCYDALMPALTVKQLVKTYANGKVALKGIDLTVNEGDFFALLGQNGAGKSTTIGIISSLVNKTSGKVEVFGHDIDTEPYQAKSLIGIVPQEMNFNPFEKVIQILTNQAGYYDIPYSQALETAETYLNEMMLWDMRNEPAINLSGGMKRRLMIARALMNHPKLLILDEPTAGVDIELRRALWRFLKKINQQGITIILTTHYLEEAEQLCKHVAIIDHGEIIEHANMRVLISGLTIQTLILDLTAPLTFAPSLPNHTCHLVDETTLEVELSRGQTVNALFTHLTQQNIQCSGMRNKTNRLEELFMRLISENHS